MISTTMRGTCAQERYLGGPSCPKCGGLIIAPETSELMSDEQIRHTWSCDECGYKFQTLIRFPAVAHASR
jgi:Zn ribbon nucleic-acid-binding protein